jgi:hypothetical protein
MKTITNNNEDEDENEETIPGYEEDIESKPPELLKEEDIQSNPPELLKESKTIDSNWIPEEEMTSDIYQEYASSIIRQTRYKSY